MKAFLIKKIEIETREVGEYRDYIHVANFPAPMMAKVWEVGEQPPQYVETIKEDVYRRILVHNPETFESKNYFVKLDDENLFKDIVAVTNGFIEEKIDNAVLKWKDRFFAYELPEIRRDMLKRMIDRLKKLPWYKRLFNIF